MSISLISKKRKNLLFLKIKIFIIFTILGTGPSYAIDIKTCMTILALGQLPINDVTPPNLSAIEIFYDQNKAQRIPEYVVIDFFKGSVSLDEIIKDKDSIYSEKRKELVKKIKSLKYPHIKTFAHFIKDHFAENQKETQDLIKERQQLSKNKTTLIQKSKLPGGREINTPTYILNQIYESLQKLEDPLSYVEDSKSGRLSLLIPVKFPSSDSKSRDVIIKFKIVIEKNKTDNRLEPVQIFPVYDSAASTNPNYPVYEFRHQGNTTNVFSPELWTGRRVFGTN